MHSAQPRSHPLPLVGRVLAAVLLLHVATIVALAASPRLHHWVHPDADDDDHDCAVVLFLHGGCHAAPAAIVPALAAPADFQLAVFVHLAAPAVPSVFSLSRVFEHAPPRVA